MRRSLFWTATVAGIALLGCGTEPPTETVSETAPDISDWENMTEEDEEAFEVFREKMNEIYERRSSIIDERRTGFVWLYRQK